MKTSEYKNHDDLPLFFNTEIVAKKPDAAPPDARKSTHDADRIAVPKGKFAEWVAQHKRGRESS